MKSKFYIRLSLVFTALLGFTFIGTSQTTISVQVADGMDDIEEAAEDWSGHPTGTIDESSSDLEFINEDGLQFVGMIFRNVQIPKDANITNAYIQFYSDKALDGPVTCELYGASEANVVAPFTADPFSVSVHPRTIAKVAWSPGPWGDPGVATEAERSPDISSIIQEIVTLDGWASGNNLMIASTGDSLGKITNREAVSYDGNPLQAPILNVTYNTNPIGIAPTNAEFSSNIYPNPTEGKLYISNLLSGKYSFEIFSLDGRLVEARYQLSEPDCVVDLSTYSKGMYFVKVKTVRGTDTHKVILR